MLTVFTANRSCSAEDLHHFIRIAAVEQSQLQRNQRIRQKSTHAHACQLSLGRTVADRTGWAKLTCQLCPLMLIPWSGY
eukprot:SAG31_NODE_1165_length_9578_cov_5.386011_7_plen_79_part_00